MKLRGTALALAAGLLVWAGAAPAVSEAAEQKDTVEAVAKKVLEKNQDAMVRVRSLANWYSGMPGVPPKLQGTRDERVELTGIIVHDSGMVVCTLEELEPGPFRGTFGDLLSWKTKELVSVMLGDGTEIPADLVMKDPDLGIAFIRIRSDAPQAKGKKFTAIDLRDSGDAAVLDRVIELDRMSGALNYQASVRIGSIVGLAIKPNKLLVDDDSGVISGNLAGTRVPYPAVFCADGKILGIKVLRAAPERLNNSVRDAAIRPAADILKVLEQVMKAQVEPKKEEPAKTE